MVFGQVVDDLWGEPIDATATLGTQDHRSLAGFANQGFQQIPSNGIDDPVGVVNEEQPGTFTGRRGRWVSTVIAERSSSTKSGADASRNHVTRRTLEARSGSSNPPDLIRP